MILPIYAAFNGSQQILIIVSRKTKPVANTCHLKTNCRCKPDDRAGCWNEKVTK